MRIRIGFLYLALAVLNIIVLSAMIFENQLDMLRLNFRLQSDRIAGIVLSTAEELDPSRIDDLNALDRILSENHVVDYTIFNDRGEKLFARGPSGSALRADGMVDESVRRATLNLRATSLIRQRYSVELNENDYTAHYVMALPSAKFERPAYLTAVLRVADFEERYRQLYRQAAAAAGLVFLAHALFAFVVVRIFFRRIGILANASEHLAEGNLSSRASWNMNAMDEVDLLGSTFNHMASRIESTFNAVTTLNAEIQNELAIGKEVQEKFLPDEDALAEWKAAAFSRPLREVSGDVYSFFETTGQRGIFFADASGHGVSAALITSLALLSLERIQETAYSAEEMAAQMNSAVLNHLKTTMFYMTSVFALYDGDRLHYVNAGHPSPVLIRRDGEIEMLESTGPPIGIQRDAEFTGGSVQAEPGDRLFFFSDGLLETPGENGETLELDEALDLLRGASSCSEGLSALLAKFHSMNPAYRDDVSLLFVELP